MSSPTRRGDGRGLVGTLLERRYRVDSVIARGGMSTVYRGLDTRLERPVAIKVMDSQYSGDRSFIERFEREARSAAKLHHPNIVAVYDQGVDHAPDSDHIFLIMQLIEGCTLRDLLCEHGKLPLPLALSVIEPVLTALSAAHEAGMVHRDIKPENVLISKDGSVKVADFGLVRAAASAGTTSGSVILGTVAYLSPEQVTTGAADPRTDNYAVGIVLYELLTGAPPHQADTPLSVAYQHVNSDVPAPSQQVAGLPASVDELVLRATRRDASGRPLDASAFLAELQALRRELGIELVPVPVPAAALQPVPDDTGGPPTDTIPPVPDQELQPDQAPRPDQGPLGTRAMARAELDPDQTQNFAAVGGDVRHSPVAREAQRQRGRRAVGVAAMVILLVAGLIGGAAWWLGSGRYIPVPSVAGQPEAAARAALQRAELTPTITREVHNVVPEGTVISSSPSAGTRVLNGEEVKLVVSLGRPKVPAIDAGTSVTDAERILRDAKLQPRLDEAANQYDPAVPKGAVLGIDPPAGTAVAIRAVVTIAVSKGPPPVPVPDVRGLSRDDAFAALSQAGFEPYEQSRRFAFNVDNDHVISTDPAGGTVVRMSGRTRVGVVLSNAVVVPDFNGMSANQARRIAADAGLDLRVQSFWERPDAVIFGQFPPAGTRVEPGSAVRVTAF